MIQFAIRFFRRIHFAGFRFFAADETIVRWIVEADSHRFFRRECLRHLSSNIYTDCRICSGTGVVEEAANPAVFLKLLGVARGLPDFRRAKMRTIGIWITDALDDSEFPVVK